MRPIGILGSRDDTRTNRMGRDSQQVPEVATQPFAVRRDVGAFRGHREADHEEGTGTLGAAQETHHLRRAPSQGVPLHVQRINEVQR